MCGEDGIKGTVYNMKGGHAEKDRNIEKNEEKTQEENLKNKRTVSISKKNQLLYQLQSIYKREIESFYF